MKFIDWISKFGFNDFEGKWVNPSNQSELASAKCLYLVDSPFYGVSPIKNLKIPRDITSLNDLETLVVSCESIIGAGFLKDLRSLKSVRLYNLKNVPHELFEIPSLKSIYFNNCGEWELDSRNESTVEEISLFDDNPNQGGLVEYPIEISFLKTLRSLSLEYHFPKQLIPFSFESISGLRKLNIGLQNLFEQSGPNLLVEIPGIEENVDVLVDLECLKLNSVAVSDVPKLLSNKKCLEQISIVNCGLEQIPEEVRLMTNLKELDFRCNEISQLPKWLNFAMDVKI